MQTLKGREICNLKFPDLKSPQTDHSHEGVLE